MLKQTTVTLSAEEAKIIIEILQKAPLQGNMITLPPLLSQMVEIAKRLEEAFDDSPRLREG